MQSLVAKYRDCSVYSMKKNRESAEIVCNLDKIQKIEFAAAPSTQFLSTYLQYGK